MQTTFSHCGACGTPCGIGQLCTGGTCVDQGDGGVAESCNPGPGSVRQCYDGPTGTLGVGACRAGNQYCMGSTWEPWCSGQVVPRAETCGDNLDNDCDGLVDDGCPPNISPTSIRILTGDTWTFNATGGAPPYFFSMAQAPSGGAVAPISGVYSAGPTTGTDQVRVTDADGGVANASAEVVLAVPLFATPSGGTAQMFDSMQVGTAVNCVLSASVDGQSRGLSARSADTYDLSLMLYSSGTYPVVITASCPGGRTRTETFTFVVDRDPPPTPLISAPLANSSVAVADGGALLVFGTAEPDVEVTARLAAFPYSATGTAFSVDGGAWTVSIPDVRNGQQFLYARARDLSGNASAETAPVLITITGAAPSELSAWSVESSVSAGQTIQVYGLGGTPPYVWSLPSPVNGSSVTPTGSFFGGDGGTSNLVLTDSADASVVVSLSVVGPLALEFTAPLDGATVTGPSVTVSLQTSPDTTVDLFVDGMLTTGFYSGPSTTASGLVSLTPGPHVLRAEARSMFSGQTASRTVAITVN